MSTGSGDVLAVVVRPGPFLAIIAAAAIAATLAALASERGIVIPVVVIELVLGVVIGPYVLGMHADQFMLIPILSDSGELTTRFGTFMLAAGAVGEFGPVLLITLILTAQSTLHNAVILIAFTAVAVGVAALVTRSSTRTLPLFERTLESSSQLAVRWILVLILALVVLAFRLGLDLLLGGFAAGMIARQVLGDRDVPAFDSKLTAIAFGVFVPFFFVVSGMRLDLPALFASVGAMAKMGIFFFLFLVVRGTPALLLYRRVLDRRERMALAFMSSTQLPLVLAITTLAVADGHMRPSTAAALVGAAVLSTLFFPVLGLRLRGDLSAQPAVGPNPQPFAL